MIKSLLIANRGEIAVRIIRTCQRLGIRAIAVYSEADRQALHTVLADEARLIGPADSTRSYLNAEAIIAAAKAAGAEAIHPGYGFLSESEALIACCEREGIVFVGPHREAIRLMGSKLEAKSLAEQHDVPMIPGYHGSAQDEATLLQAAEHIGYPLMIKASAGGGGRGMRRVDNLDQLRAALPEARQEALAAFGDDKVLLEKLIETARHIEVQVAADKHGNAVHLFERECSIQRNHQKVIEEAPAAYLTGEQRDALFRHALTLTRAIGYDSLGTVEFLLDQHSGESYFLEMNTRLQVEHPVTEQITGLDLVEWQIRIAAGATLPCEQDKIQCQGWAIEARVNAEDPAHNYQPQTGEISDYREPTVSGLRIDSGIAAGSSVSAYYDSMLAKLIAYGGDRNAARQTLIQGLRGFRIDGIGTNLAFLADVLENAAFVEQPLHTAYLPAVFPEGWRAPKQTAYSGIIAAVVATLYDERGPAHVVSSPWHSLGDFRLLERAGLPGWSRVYLCDQTDEIQCIEINGRAGNYQIRIEASNEKHSVLARNVPGNLIQVEIEGLSQTVEAIVDPGENPDGQSFIQIGTAADRRQYRRLREEDLALGAHGTSANSADQVSASLPGQVVEIHTEPGATVQAGETLAVLDSMKLLHNLSAPRDGVVGEILCSVGESVEGGAVLIELQPAKGEQA